MNKELTEAIIELMGTMEQMQVNMDNSGVVSNRTIKRLDKVVETLEEKFNVDSEKIMEIAWR